VVPPTIDPSALVPSTIGSFPLATTTSTTAMVHNSLPRIHVVTPMLGIILLIGIELFRVIPMEKKLLVRIH
jgi:hypothetical protein